MKIDHLREFIVFAKHLNFTAAAKELMMTQPGLSNHIAQLERTMGAQLVERGVPLKLTPCGLALLKGSQKLVADYDEMVASVRAAMADIDPIRVHELMDVPGMVEAVMGATGVPIEFVQRDYANPVFEDLKNDFIEVTFIQRARGDAGYAQRLESMGLAATPLSSETVCICVEKTSPLAQKQRLTREDLRGAEIVINAVAWFDIWRPTVEYMLGEGLDVRFRLDPVRSAANVRFVKLGDAVHICCASTMSNAFANRDDLAFFYELDGEPLMVEWDAVYKRNNARVLPLINAIEAFRECVEDGTAATL